MKHTNLLLIIFILSIKVFSQPILEKKYNMLRPGDKIIKQQIKYKDPGRIGKNVLWDFSQQELINENYKLFYLEDGDSIIIGQENRTLYKYTLRGDSLFSLGLEKPTMKINNLYPELLLVFPFHFQDKIEDYYYGKGKYCNQINIKEQGKSQTIADAYGMMILPNQDTLKHVIRIHHSKRIVGHTSPLMGDQESENDVYSLDSIDYHLADSAWIQLDNYRWYTDGHRYPILETIESTFYNYGKKENHFNTAFYFSPESQLTLEDDANHEKRNTITQREKKKARYGTGLDSENDTYYNIFYDHENNEVIVEYMLEEPSEVSLFLYDMQGCTLESTIGIKQSTGFNKQSFHLNSNVLGTYLFKMMINDRVFTEKIIKR